MKFLKKAALPILLLFLVAWALILLFLPLTPCEVFADDLGYAQIPCPLIWVVQGFGGDARFTALGYVVAAIWILGVPTIAISIYRRLDKTKTE